MTTLTVDLEKIACDIAIRCVEYVRVSWHRQRL